MRSLGALLVAAGVAYLLIAFNMDVSVKTDRQFIPGVGLIGGQEVANLDLMARRQNHLIVAALITIAGILMGLFAKGDLLNDPKAKPNAGLEFDGDRNLHEDKYRLWLADRYKIERNAVFDRFVFDDQTFETLDEALEDAHAKEEVRLSALKSEEDEGPRRDGVHEPVGDGLKDQATARLAAVGVLVVLAMAAVISIA